MITYKEGDIFRDNANAIVNPVNCMGVMGKGLALQFKEKYIENFRAYANECSNGNVDIGKMFVYEYKGMPHTRYVINFPTKKHWRNQSELSYIESGLKDLAKVISDKHIKTIAIPALGCGLGGLDWAKVRPMIEKELGGLDTDIRLYCP